MGSLSPDAVASQRSAPFPWSRLGLAVAVSFIATTLPLALLSAVILQSVRTGGPLSAFPLWVMTALGWIALPAAAAIGFVVAWRTRA